MDSPTELGVALVVIAFVFALGIITIPLKLTTFPHENTAQHVRT